MFKKLLCAFLLFAGLLGSDAEAVDIMLPESYDKGIDVSGWLMSEKLDGVRGYWDGRHLLSKNGTPFHPPSAFTRNFPDFAIEGEIWGGRNTFEKTVGNVKKENPHEGWLALKFAVFDVPKASGGFEKRLNKAVKWFDAHPSPYAFVIAHVPVKNQQHLFRELKRIEALGGEGIILRKPGSLYAKGRSRNILKVKSYADMEAVVIGHLAGTGRNKNRMGSLLMKLPGSQTTFKIGTGFSDALRDNPPPVGSLVTFKYYGFYASGIPKFPSFLRIRKSY